MGGFPDRCLSGCSLHSVSLALFPKIYKHILSCTEARTQISVGSAEQQEERRIQYRRCVLRLSCVLNIRRMKCVVESEKGEAKEETDEKSAGPKDVAQRCAFP